MAGAPTVEIQGPIYRFGAQNVGTLLITAPPGDAFPATAQVDSVRDDSQGIEWSPSSKLIANGRQMLVTIRPRQERAGGGGFGHRGTATDGLGDSLALGSPGGGSFDFAYKAPSTTPTGSVTITISGSTTDSQTSLVVPGVSYSN